MTSEDNKRTVIELFTRLGEKDIEGALALMTDDVSWRLPGRTELLPIAGEYDKERMRRLFERMLGQLDDHGLRMKVVELVAEGDRVGAEVEGSGDLRNGRQYRQQYCFSMRFRDGKIAAVHEHFDTQHAFDVWFRR